MGPRAALALAAIITIASVPLAILATQASALAYGVGHEGREPGQRPPWLAFADPATVYATYGKAWAPLLATLGGLVLAARRDVAQRLGPASRWPLALVALGLPLAALGTVGDYWLGEERLGRPLWGATFMVTMLAILVATIGFARLAWLARRVLPSGVAAGLASPLLGIPINILLLANAPAAYVPTLGAGVCALALVRAPRAEGRDIQVHPPGSAPQRPRA